MDQTMQIIAQQDAGVVALTLVLLMILAWGIGVWMGRRLRLIGTTTPSKFDDASNRPSWACCWLSPSEYQ
jgi:hypothetical protein